MSEVVSVLLGDDKAIVVPDGIRALQLEEQYTEVVERCNQTIARWWLVTCLAFGVFILALAGGITLMFFVPVLYAVLFPAVFIVFITALGGANSYNIRRGVRAMHSFCEQVTMQPNVAGRAQFTFRSETAFLGTNLLYYCDFEYPSATGGKELNVELNGQTSPAVPLVMQSLGLEPQYQSIVVDTAGKVAWEESVVEVVATASALGLVYGIVVVCLLTDNVGIIVGVVLGLVAYFVGLVIFTRCRRGPIDEAKALCETANNSPDIAGRAAFSISTHTHTSGTGKSKRTRAVHTCCIKW